MSVMTAGRKSVVTVWEFSDGGDYDKRIKSGAGMTCSLEADPEIWHQRSSRDKKKQTAFWVIAKKTRSVAN